MRENRLLRLFYIALPLLLALLSYAPAWAVDSGELVRKLQEKYDSIQSVEADFSQEVSTRAMKTSQKSGGKVWFKKPGKMRWEYRAPVRDEIVSDGRSVWVWQPDLNQAIEKRVAGPSALATDFLSGLGKIKREFETTGVEDRGDTWRLGLKPRQEDSGVRRLSLDIDKSSMLVVRTIVHDQFGGETKVSFRNIKTNPEMRDSLFEFTPPKGANIVRTDR